MGKKRRSQHMAANLTNEKKLNTNVQDAAIQHKKVDDTLISLNNALASRRDSVSIFNNYYSAETTIDPAQLENIYLSNWVAKKIVEIPIEYMFKNGFTVKIDGYPEVEKEVMRLYEKHFNNGKENLIKKTLKDRDIYGGSVILVKNFMQDPMMPMDYQMLGLNAENIRFTERDYSYLAINPHVHITEPDFFLPKTISMAGITADVSNYIVFYGVHVPTRRIPNFKYLGMSVYQNIFQAMIIDDYVNKGIANLINRGNRYYYKMKGFNDMVKQKTHTMTLDRLSLLEDQITLLSAGVLDSEDDIIMVQQSFASLPEIDLRAIERLSAATSIPATILLGKSPDGMNATGQSDWENLYNWIEAQQARVKPQMEQIFKILCCMATRGTVLPLVFEWNKPHNVNPKDEADTETKVLDNALKMQSLGLGDEIIKDYLVAKTLITHEQADSITELQTELEEMAEGEGEEEIQETDTADNK